MKRWFSRGMSMRPFRAIARLSCVVLVALTWGIAHGQEALRTVQGTPAAVPADPAGPMWDMAKLSKPPQMCLDRSSGCARRHDGPRRGPDPRRRGNGFRLVGAAVDVTRVCGHCHGHLRMRAQRLLWALGTARCGWSAGMGRLEASRRAAGGSVDVPRRRRRDPRPQPAAVHAGSGRRPHGPDRDFLGRISDLYRGRRR